MVFVFGSGWRLGAGFVNPVCPGWGLGWVLLGSFCGVVPLVSAICGVRGWASVSVCFWDVCGFVGVPLAPRRFRFRRAVWACVPGPGLACAQSVLAGLSGCVFFFFFFLFFFFFGFCGLCPSIPFLSGWAGGSLFFFFFFFFFLFPVVRCYWLGVAGFGGVVRLCLCGGPPFFFFFFFFFRLGGGAWPPLVVLAGGWAAVGCFRAFSPSPLPFFFFFWGGACLFLPLPSLGWRTHWPVFSVVFRAAVFSWVLCGHVPAPWVGWALYTVGSAPLLAGLGPGSAAGRLRQAAAGGFGLGGWGCSCPYPSAVPAVIFWVVRHRCRLALCGPVCGLWCRCAAWWRGAFPGVRWLASVSPSG